MRSTSKADDWGADAADKLIIVDKLLERLPANKLKPILDSCVPDSGFIAFRPFLRHPQATTMFHGGTKNKLVVSATQKLLDADPEADSSKYVIDLLGFPGCLLMAYRMHAVAVMAPHDWWNCIAQCISQQVHLEHRVKRDDVNMLSGLHQDNVRVGVTKPTVSAWLREMEASVHSCMEYKTDLPAMMQRSFTTSTEVSDLVNLNSAVCAFKFRFVPNSSFREQEFLCGLYGVQMLGTLEDWQLLRQSFDELCVYLKSSSEDYGIEIPWMEGVQYVLDMLISTLEHNGRHSQVRRFWKDMLAGETANCSGGSQLHGWLSFLFSCKVIDQAVDLKAVPIDFAVSCLPFTAEAFNCSSDYELCTGIVGYNMRFDRESDRWFVEPRHECCLFKY